MLPLYQGAELARNLKDDANRGLWWSRFFNKYGLDFSKPDVGGKGEFISEICKKNCGDADELAANALRQVSLFTALGGVHSCYQTQGRFVTGMGNDHPTENGFTWHPTLGVPYLPASSVKGLVRGWIEWNGDAHTHHPNLKSWFGSQTKSEVSEQAGWFIFFDALPTAPVQLAADVMTPHYGKWYEQGGDDEKNTQADTVPADWHSPVPVTFLTVKKATFQFGIAVRAGLKPDVQAAAQTALHQVLTVLQDALEWAGAGAKTATGYGRMAVDEKTNQELVRLRAEVVTKQQEQQRLMSLQTLSVNQRVIEELRIKIAKQTGIAKIPKGNALWTEIKKLALEQTSDWGSADKIALADMLQASMPLLMSGIDAKDIRKELKLNALRGIV
jgi:CRISPR-associated protein Cmr6